MPAINAQHVLTGRSNTATQEKALICILAIAAIVFFGGVMTISIHRALMAAREERLGNSDDHKSRSVFVKLAAWIWGGIVLLVCAFFAPFTRTFWKETWADTRALFSPYSSLGAWTNAYTCGCYCNPDPDHDPGLAGIAGARGKKPSSGDGGVVAQEPQPEPEPKPDPTVAVTETPDPQLPAPAVVVGEV